jgi:hypothetical protein
MSLEYGCENCFLSQTLLSWGHFLEGNSIQAGHQAKIWGQGKGLRKRKTPSLTRLTIPTKRTAETGKLWLEALNCGCAHANGLLSRLKALTGAEEPGSAAVHRVLHAYNITISPKGNKWLFPKDHEIVRPWKVNSPLSVFRSFSSHFNVYNNCTLYLFWLS